eukprot:247491_1
MGNDLNSKQPSTLSKKNEYFKETVTAYSKYANKCINNWGKGKLTQPYAFLKELINTYCKNQDKCNIIDIGCGLGYDTLAFANGCSTESEIIGIDGTNEFINYAQIHHKKTNLKFVKCQFKDIFTHKLLFENKFDICWANASLIHIPKHELDVFLHDLHSICTGKSIFAGVFCYGNGEGYSYGKFVPGRYFSSYNEQELATHFETNDWNVIGVKLSETYPRAGKWIEIIAQEASTQL